MAVDPTFLRFIVSNFETPLEIVHVCWVHSQCYTPSVSGGGLVVTKKMISIFVTLATASVANAAKPKSLPRYEFDFGPEFTFSNQPLLQTYVAAGGGQRTVVIQTTESIQALTDYSLLMQQKLIQKRKAPWQYLETHDSSWNRSKLNFFNPSGFQIVALSDPGVIEVNHSPINVKNAVRKGPSDLHSSDTAFRRARELPSKENCIG